MSTNTSSMALKSLLWGIRPLRGNRIQVASRKEVEVQLVRKSMISPGFRRRLLQDPKSVLKAEMGIDLPGELAVCAVEETANHIYYSLPCNPYAEYTPQDLLAEFGLSLAEVARWTLQQQRNTMLDETSSVELLVNAWSDSAFRRLLMERPGEVIEGITGACLPHGIQVTVLEETAHCVYLVLPKVIDFGVVDFGDTDLWSTANVGPDFIAVASGDPNCMKFSCPFLSCTTTTRTTGCMK